jgi:hypothetical protein
VDLFHRCFTEGSLVELEATKEDEAISENEKSVAVDGV